ncbi:hypothetical protein EMEDMD4_980003 [Sinorhizobium medicae]|uniref:Uncharacterized protein n=1 Tax=Sinorhizobium medicae TaxID=110321 RepID=A0A508X8N6_9HYPH|nr:hypothetical protein EMEDMD4_980003 [Sinorhizobium medicae]
MQGYSARRLLIGRTSVAVALLKYAVVQFGPVVPLRSTVRTLNSVFRRKQRSWIQPRIQTNPQLSLPVAIRCAGRRLL